MFEYDVKHKLDDEEVKDILTTAIEGGIGYWACLGNDDPAWAEARDKYKAEHNERPCYCDVAFELLNNNKAVVFYDEEDDDKQLLLTKENFINGCKLYEEHVGKTIHTMLDTGEFDANDADMIIQYSLFGEVIYG